MLVAASAAALRADYDAEASARKVDYYFLEGLRQRALGHEDLSAAMMARALELSNDKSVREAYETGGRMMLFGSQNRDSIVFARGLELCETYFDKHPDDVFAGSYLANYHAGANHVDRAIAIYETLAKTKPDNVALTAGHADMLLRARRLDEAIGLYRKLEKTMGRNPAITQRIINVLIWQGDTVAAIAEADDLINALPRSVEALQLGASAASEFGRNDLALGYIERAKQLDPTNGTTYYYAANVYKAMGRNDDYDQAIKAAITGDDIEPDAKIELLRYYISEEIDKEEGSSKIDPLFESLIAQYTHDYQIRHIYTSYLATQKRWSEAAEQLSHAVAVSPENPEDFILLARLYGSADNYDGLLEATVNGLEHHPDYIELYQLQAAAFMRKENLNAASATLERALALDSIAPDERSDIYRDIADIGQRTDAPRDSIVANYERALKLNPENDLAMNNYAYWLSTIDGGDLLRAKELISRAVVFEPGSSTYYDTFAWVCYRLGDLENAKRYIDMAILFDKSELSGNTESMAEMLGHAADIYESLGQHDKADEYRTRAARLTDDE